MPNVQYDLQIADFQAFEKQSAPRSKFVKAALSDACFEVGRLQLLRKESGNAGKRHFRKESENAMKRDSLGRSAVWIYGENGYWRVACDPGGIFADSHIDYHWIRNPAEFSLEVAIFAG